MSDPETPAGNDDLQFDRVVPQSSADAPAASTSVGVVCSSCRESIPIEYYEINGHVVCGRCKAAIEAAAETPAGAGPFITAAWCGLGGGIVGAIIYFSVLYFANLEIGIVAILIGYMVGFTVRKGAGGRGGLRFQILAVALTYGSVALAYTPVVIMSMVQANRAAQNGTATGAAAPTPAARTTEQKRPNALVAIAFTLGFIAALPVLMVIGSFPTGLISAFIIFIGMRQAWTMTAAPQFNVFGPYQVGTAATSGAV